MASHSWSYCHVCEEQMVLCGACGNNTCNGCYGEINGEECKDCVSAYEMYFSGAGRPIVEKQ